MLATFARWTRLGLVLSFLAGAADDCHSELNGRRIRSAQARGRPRPLDWTQPTGRLVPSHDARGEHAGRHRRPGSRGHPRAHAAHRQLAQGSAAHLHPAQHLGDLRPRTHSQPARLLRRPVPLPVAVLVPVRQRVAARPALATSAPGSGTSRRSSRSRCSCCRSCSAFGSPATTTARRTTGRSGRRRPHARSPSRTRSTRARPSSR